MLTKKQKIAAYKYCIRELKGDYPGYNSERASDIGTPFICDILMKWYADLSHKPVYLLDRDKYISLLFPEFNSCRPNRISSPGWWTDTDEGIFLRLVVLQWCIDSLTSK